MDMHVHAQLRVQLWGGDALGAQSSEKARNTFRKRQYVWAELGHLECVAVISFLEMAVSLVSTKSEDSSLKEEATFSRLLAQQASGVSYVSV